MGEGWGATFTEGLFVLGGLLGSKYFTQLVLGASNTGVLGYGGNLVAGGLLSWGVNSFLKNRKGAQAVFVGSVIEVIIRLLNDYTPYGSYVKELGVGDYLASNWVSPQRYVDPMRSAQVEIPGGWAPTTQVVVSSNAAPKGVSGLYSGSRDSDSLY